ncbi:hypothetical protein NIES4071_00550 [Calothrix sp. NIES-4071]|nr:hypothetical protein NIES4071_00550 [Calothrix sp. NIES-4071]BAZ54401.1 hypothetical protein NIES4105_00540 [Calothrix sp. NIES-4105]
MFNRLLLKAALLVCALCPVISYGFTQASVVNAQLMEATPNQILATTQNNSSPSETESQSRTATGRGSTSIKVSLIRQDSSDCVNSDVTKKSGSHHNVGGFIHLNKNPHDGELQMKVSLTNGTPNTKYNVFLKCKQQIGYVYTNKKGVVSAYLSAPLSIVPPVFAFDMYPDGAPSGNKFQSVQVKY